MAYWTIAMNYCGIRRALCKGNEFSKYLTPRKFYKKRDALAWVKRNTYKGMSHEYEITKHEEQ